MLDVAITLTGDAGEAPRYATPGDAGCDLVASEHAVPIVEAPPLARALHASCELGAEVPARLYAAVAQLLTYVFQLRVATRVGRPLPPQPQIDIQP